MRYLKAHWTRISVPHATQMLRFKFASLLCPFHDFLTHSLQVWFRDMAFRSGVYNCQSTEGSADKFKALFPHIHIFLKLTLTPPGFAYFPTSGDIRRIARNLTERL